MNGHREKGFVTVLLNMFKFIVLVCCVCLVTSSTAPNIAIVGGGIGGTSCAYFLRELFGEGASLTLYEKDTIGGRLNLINVDGSFYEAGGAVIHPRNQHMVDFVKLLDLKIRKPLGGKFGIYDGKTFVFRESEWSIVTMADFLWRYGFSALDLRHDVKSMLDEFSSIYDLQKKEFAFTTVSGLLEFMSPKFRNMTQESLHTFMTRKNYSKLLLKELVQSIMMVNYGQTNNITAFTGFVSLAGADDNLFSVEGGNKGVPEGLLGRSKASVVDGDVQEITLLSDSTYLLKYNDPFSTQTKTFDIVILAAPFVKNQRNIKFTNFQKDFSQYERPYHSIVATFVQGNLNPLAFQLPDVPDEVLTFKTDLPYNSIGRASSVNEADRRGPLDVYKVFSQQPLPQKTIDTLFENVELVKQKDWLAYPHYMPPEKLPPFFLAPGLYYVNGIELSASAMEMSAIAGRNAALLAFNLWTNKVDKVDHHRRTYKDEL